MDHYTILIPSLFCSLQNFYNHLFIPSVFLSSAVPVGEHAEGGPADDSIQAEQVTKRTQFAPAQTLGAQVQAGEDPQGHENPREGANRLLLRCVRLIDSFHRFIIIVI